MDVNILQLIIIFVGGVAAGIINTIAGGGTLIAFPLLVFVGVEPIVAVATNRLAIVIQTLIASVTFKRGGVGNLKLSIMLAIPATITSILGAWIATIIDKKAFSTAVAILILMVLAIIIIDPKKRLAQFNKNPEEQMSSITRNIIGIVVFFLIGLYGGFFGAGIGIMILTALFLTYDLDFLRGNGVKVVINLILSLGAVAMFAYKGKINYMLAIPLSIANGTGAYIGAKISLKGGHKWIKRVVLLVGLISVIKLIFFR
jgi:hypothetical protein